MGGPAAARSPFVAGRVDELRVLEQAIQAAAEGEPCAVFVHGEAGVGKTLLVRRVCHEARRRGFAVLWGQCVRFGAVESPYLPVVTALERWLDEADLLDRDAVLDAVGAAKELLPSLRNQRPGQARLVTIAEALITEIASRRPMVLVIDDVQWADLSSRDALAYLVAGFRHQRLAIVTTHRAEELNAGHPMHGWLTDMRRLPTVAEVRLTRLNRDETEQQIAHLFVGGHPQPQLAAEVHRRSQGNPYLTELLVTGLTQDDEQLRPELPVGLTDALLAAWHRLSPSARETTRLVALAGRPTRTPRGRGVPNRHARLAETSGARILDELGDDPPDSPMPVREGLPRSAAAWALARGSETTRDLFEERFGSASMPNPGVHCRAGDEGRVSRSDDAIADTRSGDHRDSWLSPAADTDSTRPTAWTCTRHAERSTTALEEIRLHQSSRGYCAARRELRADEGDGRRGDLEEPCHLVRITKVFDWPWRWPSNGGAGWPDR